MHKILIFHYHFTKFPNILPSLHFGRSLGRDKNILEQFRLCQCAVLFESATMLSSERLTICGIVANSGKECTFKLICKKRRFPWVVCCFLTWSVLCTFVTVLFLRLSKIMLFCNDGRIPWALLGWEKEVHWEKRNFYGMLGSEMEDLGPYKGNPSKDTDYWLTFPNLTSPLRGDLNTDPKFHLFLGKCILGNCIWENHVLPL